MQCFHKLEDLGICFHNELTVIVGANGSGKTSVLICAAITLDTVFYYTLHLIDENEKDKMF